ncbi:MAG TPA: CDP-alcohol phosphatidyltransferase family protein [Actinomycetota bacterium]|nr:CDP-alcohol phosphatidyltransferase family protein [Actinomycetota bacterium]
MTSVAATEKTVGEGRKKLDYWWTVLATDPVSVPIVRFLTRRRWLTPDQVTIVALVLGLASGVLMSFGSRSAVLAGGIAFYLAFVFDCVDGKLARALGTTSARGAGLDALADGGRRASATLGLAVYLWNHETPPTQEFWFLMVYAVLAYYFIEISGAEKKEPARKLAGRWGSALARRRLLPTPGMPDVQAIVFIIGPVTGYVVPALQVGIVMVVIAILMTVVRRLRTS